MADKNGVYVRYVSSSPANDIEQDDAARLGFMQSRD